MKTSKNKSVKMGLQYNTKYFQICPKKLPNDALALTTSKGVVVSLSVARWIELDPILLWSNLHCKRPLFSLGRNAYSLLCQKMEIIAPEMLSTHKQKMKTLKFSNKG